MGDPGTSYPNPDAYQAALGNALPPSNHELAQALLAPFGQTPPVYRNPQFVDKATLDWNRKLAQQLMTPMQVHRPAEGFANVIRAGIGGAMEYQADTAAQGAQSAYTDALARVAGAARGDGGADGTPPAPSAPSDNSAAAPQGGFDSNVNRTLGFEGGYNPHDANGAPVNMGINAAANPDVDVAKLTPDQAKQLYRERYWDPIGADNLSPALQRAAFDTSVIAGPGKAKELLAASGGDPNKFMDMREQFQNGLVQSDPAKFGRFADAWASRNAGLRSDIAALSSQGGGSAAGAIASAAPQGSAPSSAMSFAGSQQPTGNMLSVAPPGLPQAAAPVDSQRTALTSALLNGAPPTQAPTAENRALAHALLNGTPSQQGLSPQDRATLAHTLIHGAPPQAPGAQDYAIAISSPWGTPESRAVAEKMLVPELVRDPYNGLNAFRPGDAQARNVLRGAHFGTISTPDASVETVTTGGGNGPQGATRIVAPPAPAGSADAQHPLSGVAGIVNDAQHMRAKGQELYGDLDGDTRVVNSAKANSYAAQQSLVGLQQAADAAQKAGYGVIPNLQAIAGHYGINTSGLSEIAAFKKVAGAVANSDPVLGPHLAAALPDMEDNKESRQLIMNRLLTIAQRQSEMGRVAFDGTMSMHDRASKLSDYPLPEAQQPAAAAPRAGSVMSPAPGVAPGLPLMSSPDQARALPPGTKFRTPDGRVLVR